MKYRYCLFMALFIGAMLASLSGVGQTKVYSYRYDDSGNRENRQFIQLKSASIRDTTSLASDIKPINEILAEQIVTIFPNPTKGELNISIQGLNDSEALLQVYSMKGSTIYNKRVSGNFNKIDLSKQPPGMYVLKITIGNNSTDWKIIKD